MPRTALTAQKFTASGLDAQYVIPDALGVSFRNTGKCVLHVKNGSGASITLTPKIGKQVLGQSVASSPATTVAAAGAQFFGPFVDDYEQPGLNDTVYVDFSAVTTVSVALLQMP